MPRARLLKPSFWKNEDLARLSAHTRLCFAGLWNLADKEGRLEDRPEWIKVELFPYEGDITAQLVDEMLDALALGHFISRYVSRGKHHYIAIPKFLSHQTPHHREAPSRIPAPSFRRRASRARPKASPEEQPQSGPGLSPTVTDPVPVPVTGDPVSDPVTGKKSSGADAPRHSGNGQDRNPEESLAVITKLAHEALDLTHDPSDLVEVIKSRCAELHIPYNSGVVSRALDSAEAQRRHR
jgi:hypothetical protein